MSDAVRRKTPAEERDDLVYRLRQQCISAEFGRFALGCRDFPTLLQRAAEMAAEGMETSLSKVLKWRPEKSDLLVSAGIGWQDGVVGHATLGDDTRSPAGYAVKTGKPVISNDLAGESRFRTPELLSRHGVRRAINVIIRGATDENPFGVLEVDSRRSGAFEEADLAFMQSFASLLGVAIGRQQETERAAAYQEELRREASHRIKNSLAMISGFMAMQGRASELAEVKAALQDAQARVSAIAEVHDQLWRQADAENLNLAEFIASLCAKLGALSPEHRLVVDTEPLEVPSQKAIPIGLIVNELVTNAFKYAYSEGGEVRVSLRGRDARIELRVADSGAGLPSGFDPREPNGSLGMRVVTGLVRELGGTLSLDSGETGAHFLIAFPATRNAAA